MKEYTIWKRLEKYGHIKNLKRDGDYRRFNVYLEDGMIRIECNHRDISDPDYLTIDSFLYLFMNNLPCDYKIGHEKKGM